MVTVQAGEGKRCILAEAHRLLAPGGRLGLQELLLVPDDHKTEIQRQLSRSIRVGPAPHRHRVAPAAGVGGFSGHVRGDRPMHLLKPGRFVRDEVRMALRRRSRRPRPQRRARLVVGRPNRRAGCCRASPPRSRRSAHRRPRRPLLLNHRALVDLAPHRRRRSRPRTRGGGLQHPSKPEPRSSNSSGSSPSASPCSATS